MVSHHIIECTIIKKATRVGNKFNEVSWHVLKKKGVLLVHKANHTILTKASFPGFITSSRGLLQEESDWPTV